jgi:hypothetical protein
MQKEKSDNCRSDPQHTCLDNYRNSNNDPGHLQSNGNVTFSELFKLIHILCWSFKNGNREVDGTDGKDNTKNKLNKRSNNNEKPANGKDPTWSVLLIPTEARLPRTRQLWQKRSIVGKNTEMMEKRGMILLSLENLPATILRRRILHILPEPAHPVNKPQLAQIRYHGPKQSRPWIKHEDSPNDKEHRDSGNC